jgi:mannan endo-1,4-beta-mannosidase
MVSPPTPTPRLTTRMTPGGRGLRGGINLIVGLLVAAGALAVPAAGPGSAAAAISPPSRPGSALTVRARGTTGQEQFEVRVAGTSLGTFTATTGWRDYVVSTPSPAGAPGAEVAFVNDSTRPADRNLLVDSVIYAGVTYQAEADTTRSTGVWDNGGKCRPGVFHSEELACNGSLFFGDLAGPPAIDTDPASPGATIEVSVAGATGHELAELRLGDRPVAVFRPGPSPDLTGAPSFTRFVYHHPDPVDPNSVSVAFINDRHQPGGVDGNLRVGAVLVDGAPLRPNGVPTTTGMTTTTTSAPGKTTTTKAGGTTRTTRSTTTTRATRPTSKPTAGGGTQPAKGQFYVVGKDIVGPDGKIFYPIGANAALKFTPYGYVFEGNNGGVNDHLDSVAAWNWNTIRATLVCDNPSGVPTFDELVDGIGPTIERLTAAGIVVILECHDATGANPRLGSAKDLRIRKFWDQMVRRYGDNPHVWFNIYNEPFATGDLARWAEIHQFYVDRIRAAGAENLVVVDLPVYSQGIDLVVNSTAGDAINRSCNTVFGWHAYGAIGGQQGSVADHQQMIVRAQQKGMALIVGELGVATPANWGNAGPWEWNLSGFDAMATLGPRFGIGLLWWHATGDDAYFSLYALKNDRSGFWTAANSGNLTPYGQKFWDVSHRVSHSRGTFTGRLADSGCPSAA